MAESRVEQKARLLWEFSTVVQPLRRVLFDRNDPTPSQAKLGFAVAQWEQDFKQWSQSANGFQSFVTIDGTFVRHYYESVWVPLLRYGRNVLLSTTIDIAKKRESFETVEREVRAAFYAIPADDPDIKMVAKSAFRTYQRLHALFATASQHVHLFDQYLSDRAFLRYLSAVPDGVEVKVITDVSLMCPRDGNRRKIFRRDQIIAVSELFANDRSSHYHLLMAPDLHDRNLRIDGKIFDLGNSLARAAVDSDYSITATDSNATLHEALERTLASATAWYVPGMPRHRLWCATCNGMKDVRRSGTCADCDAQLSSETHTISGSAGGP